MKKFIIFLYSSFVLFSNFAFGQEIKKIEEIPYNEEIGDWDIVFPLPVDFCKDSITEAKIMVNGQVEFDAFVSERGIQISRKDTLTLDSGKKYFFKPFFMYESKWYTMLGKDYQVPIVFLSATYEIKNLYLKTSVSFPSFKGLIPDKEKSYFSAIDSDIDSIIYGEVERIPVERSDGNKFFGMKKLSSIGEEKRQILNSIVCFSNKFGEPKLYALEVSKFKIGGNLSLASNLVAVGSFTPYWGNGEEKNAEIFDIGGNLVAKFVAKSGEPFWPSSYFSNSGIYFLKIDNIGTAKFVVAN